ncbi:MAG: WG repeat-containing protein [Bacteroidota bacterium]
MRKFKNTSIFALLLITFLSFSVSTFAQKDPVPTRKGEKWTYSKIGGTYDEADPFYPVLQKKTVKVKVIDPKTKKPVMINGKPKTKDSSYIEEVAALATVKVGEKYGFINASGKMVIAAKYDFVRSFSPDGLAAVGIIGDPFEKWGFVDYTGREVVPPTYTGVGDFKGGYASVTQYDLNDPNKPPIGFIDKSGKLAIPFKFHQAHDFNDGMAAVYSNGKWGFINTKGVMVISPSFDNVCDFSEGLAKVNKNLSWGFINKSGREVIAFKYKGSSNDYGVFHNGLAKVSNGRVKGWVNNKGVEFIRLQYNDAHDFSDRMAAVKQGGRWGFIDQRGQFRIQPQFFQVGDFSDGLAAFLDPQTRKWGFINTSGKKVISPKYDEVDRSFNRGIALVKREGKLVYIDKTGKEYN